MSQRALFICWVGLGLLLTSPLDAQQWTRFRGPNGTGVGQAKNIPVAWTERDYDWKITLPGGTSAKYSRRAVSCPSQ